MKKGYRERIDQAAASVSTSIGSESAQPVQQPEVGLVLGSGLGSYAEGLQGLEVPYGEIDGFPVPTVAGHKGALILAGNKAIMVGRFHYYEGYSLDEVVLPIFLLHRLGVRTLILTNAAGGINRELEPGQLVLIRDHINLMGANPLRGPNPDGLGPRFPDMSEAYSGKLRILAQEEARERLDGELAEGVYAAFPGPSYETPAEIRMAERLGADLVGMSTVPEAIAASYLGMEVLGISCVTNMAAGILDKPLSHEEVLETSHRVQHLFIKLLEGILNRLTCDR